MRSCSLKYCVGIAGPPDKKPISCIGDMTFVTAEPFSFERMHIMSAQKLISRFWRIAYDQVDDFSQGV